MAEKKGLRKAFEGSPSIGSKWVVLVFVVAVVLVSAAWITAVMVTDDDQPLVDTSSYQAVFLNSGQVYFGHLSESGDGFYRLSDVYYLQTAQDANQTDENKDESNVQLNKRGNEIHGPQDEMFISADNISFWENLKADSKVVESIKNAQK